MSIALLSCGSKPQEKHKLYPLSGEITALNAKDQTATVKHGPVGDWMGAMTMEYPVKSKSEFEQLKVGEKVKATVDVHGDSDYDLTNIQEQEAKK